MIKLAFTAFALFPCVEKDLVIVSWDDKVFLVSCSTVHRFCITARENSRVDYANAIARSRNVQKSLAGKPILPKELKVFLHLPELSAKIIAVEKPVTEIADKSLRIIRQIVTLDVGAKDQVFVGMKLEVERKRKQHARMMRITEVNDNLSKAEVLDVDFNNETVTVSPIKTATKVKANQELFNGCGDPELWKQLDQTNDQLNANNAKNRELVSEISAVERKAQNAALRADQEISRSDIDRCRAQAVAFNKRAEELRAEMKSLERSNKEIQSRREQVEKQMRAW